MPDWLFWIALGSVLGALEWFVGFRGLFALLFAVNALLVAALAAAGVAQGPLFQSIAWLTLSLALARLFHKPFVRIAYNFHIVSEDKLFRSAKPDKHFVRYLKNNYGIEQIVSLIGPIEAHGTALRLGIEVFTFEWRVQPPAAELQAVLELIRNGKKTLIHCRAGRDRTGLVIAAHRMTQSGWSRERAVRDMIKFGHKPEEKPFIHAALNELASARLT